MNPSGGWEHKNLMKKAIKSKSPSVSCNLPVKIIVKKLRATKLCQKRGWKNKWWGISDRDIIDESVRWQRIRRREREGRCLWRSYKGPIHCQDPHHEEALFHTEASLWRIISHLMLFFKTSDSISHDSLTWLRSWAVVKNKSQSCRSDKSLLCQGTEIIPSREVGKIFVSKN